MEEAPPSEESARSLSPTESSAEEPNAESKTGSRGAAWLLLVAGLAAVGFLWVRGVPDASIPASPDEAPARAESPATPPTVPVGDAAAGAPPDPEPAAPEASPESEPSPPGGVEDSKAPDAEPAEPPKEDPATADSAAAATESANTEASPAADKAPPTGAAEAQPNQDASPGAIAAVRVTVHPATARIGYLGKEIGQGSVDVEIEPGTRKALEVGAPGYATRRVVVDGSTPEIKVVLKPAAAK